MDSTNGQSIPQNDVSTALKYARVLRRADENNVTSLSHEEVKEKILSALNVAIEEPKKSPVWKDTADNYELKIRHLVQIDAPWGKISDVAWRYYELKPSVDVAVHIFEVAFLSGDESDVLEVFKRLQKEELNFYGQVNKAIRTQLLVTNWKSDIGKAIGSILTWHKEANWLLPIEKLFIYVKTLGATDPTIPYKFFLSNRSAIKDAVNKIGDQVGVSRSALLLKTARNAADLSKVDEAKELLLKIRSNDKEYKEALNLILAFDQDEKQIEKSEYYLKLSSEENWEKRVELFSKYLMNIRTTKKPNNRKRAFLNLMLKDPLKWVPDLPEAWCEMARVLASAIDMKAFLPNITLIFEENSLKFNKRDLDLALWQPFVTMEKGEEITYWKGISSLHQYTASSGSYDEALWRARRYILETHKTNRHISKLNWDEVLRSLRSWATRSLDLTTEDKERVYSHLALSVDPKFITDVEIGQYLSNNPQNSLTVLNELLDITEKRGFDQERLEIIRRKTKYLSLTNSDLNSLWEISLGQKNTDFSWRICTVVHARKNLSERATYAWQISGEKRKAYQLYYPTQLDIQRCMNDFNDNEVKLCEALLEVGAMLPEMISLVDKSVIAQKYRVAPEDSVEANIDGHLNQIPWFRVGKKRYLYGEDYNESNGLVIPPFAQMLPTNEWSILLAKVVERMGLNTWSWFLSDLAESLEHILPQMNYTGAHGFDMTRVGKLFKNLEHSQKRAISDLKVVSKKISDEKAAYILAVFVCRLTTVMFQFHHQALTSLHEMRTPLAVLRNLEQWILSAEYEACRAEHGGMSRVPVPNSLKDGGIAAE